MGNGFLNPMRAADIPGRLIGSNSFVGRATAYDPLMNSGVGKVLAPNAYDKGQQYAATHFNQEKNIPGPYAGITPTLQDANNQYVLATQKAQQTMNNQRNIQPVNTGNVTPSTWG